MVPPNLLEDVILTALSRFSASEWLPFDLPNFQNRMGEVEQETHAAPQQEMVDALDSLAEQGFISIRLHSAESPDADYFTIKGNGLTPYEVLNHKMVQIRLTHDGRKYLLRNNEGAAKTDERKKVESDDLLPILRRVAFDNHIKAFVQKSDELREPLCLVMIDLDHFKKVNDTLGHPVGDDVLKQVAHLINKRVRGKGYAYRYGGEEIILILPNFEEEEGITLAESLRRLIAETPLTQHGLRKTASFGVAVYPKHANNSETLIELADKAMYKAKNLGRNLVRVTMEPETVTQEPRKSKRKQPTRKGYDETEEEEIRQQYFQSYQAICPKDNALLRISESHRISEKTPHLHIQCPLCGITFHSEGEPV